MIDAKDVVIGNSYLFDEHTIVKADEYLDNHIGTMGAILDMERNTYFTLDRLTIYKP